MDGDDVNDCVAPGSGGLWKINRRCACECCEFNGGIRVEILLVTHGVSERSVLGWCRNLFKIPWRYIVVFVLEVWNQNKVIIGLSEDLRTRRPHRINDL